MAVLRRGDRCRHGEELPSSPELVEEGAPRSTAKADE